MIAYTAIMHAVENCIKTRGHNFKCCFVFPNSISQRITFRKALDITGEDILPSELYLSWNMFIKQYIEGSENKNKEEIDAMSRYLYAQYIVTCNKKETLFNCLIPKNCNINSFARWLVSILPELHIFVHTKNFDDAELFDLHVLAKNYSDFLEKNNLYETSWKHLHFNESDATNEKKYIIIYPELIDDFSSYEDALSTAKNIEFLHINSSKDVLTPLYEAENTRVELKYVMSQIEELLLKKVPLSDIALSVVDIESLKTYIMSEAELRGIPIDFYVQTTLIENKFCSIFKEIQAVYDTHYSYEAVKKLLLNKAIVWKFASKIEPLLKFGMEHKCSVSWQEKGMWHNVWQEAFNSLLTLSQEEVESKELFGKLKQEIDSIFGCKTFDDVRSCITDFVKENVDLSKMEEIHIQAYSKCKKVLKNLNQSEKKFAKYLVEASINRYDFFVAVLEKEMIHSEVSGQGISIFPYGAGVSIPFKYHFVINLNQQDASIIRGKLKFLRDDKRDTMKIKNVDLTSHFIEGYLEAENVQFSYSKKTYQKYAIAHSFFDEVAPITTCKGEMGDSHDEHNKKDYRDVYNDDHDDYHKEDSFYREECFYLEGDAYNTERKKITNIGKIYKLQQEGMKVAEHFEKENVFSILKESCGTKIPELLKAIESIMVKDGCIAISQSDLYNFFTKCPIYFLFNKLLNLKVQSLSFSNLESKMIDRLEMGTLYHETLERVYREIAKTSEGKFLKAWLKDGSYKDIARKIVDKIKTERKYSPLKRLFICSMQSQIESKIEAVFELDAHFFDGYAIYAIEKNLEYSSPYGILYKGKIDRAMQKSCKDASNKNNNDENGACEKKKNELILLDYKTGSNTPSYNLKKERLENFQMPFYVLLLENAKINTLKSEQDAEGDSKINSSKVNPIEENLVETALFVKLLDATSSYVFSNKKNAQGKLECTREDFEGAINLLKEVAIEFKNCINQANFAPPKDIWRHCIECEYKHICRTTFFVKKQFIGK